MRQDHHYPVVATIGGDGTRLVHLVVGPHPDHPDQQATTLWAWSAALRKAYAMVVVDAEPVAIPGRGDMWTLETGEFGTVRLKVDPFASCCGDPLKRFRPPNAPRARSVTP